MLVQFNPNRTEPEPAFRKKRPEPNSNQKSRFDSRVAKFGNVSIILSDIVEGVLAYMNAQQEVDAVQ